MSTSHTRYYPLFVWGIILSSFVFRCLYSQTFLLVPDETNYWQWARHLAWGYHDQAPMIAWTIKASTFLFGDTALGVRFPSIVSMTVASVYVLLACQRWFTPRIAFHAVLLSQSILIFQIGGLLATADGLQGAAWVAASYHAARAVESNRWPQWLAGGIWFGFGMLSKYTMVLFLPCIFSFLLVSPSHRRLLLAVKPYVACLLGLAMFSPVIFWNAANDWNSVRHVAYIGGANESFSIHFKFLGDYLASQAGLLTPFVFILVIRAWYLSVRNPMLRNQWIIQFLFFTSFPVVAGFAVLSLHSRVYGNWPCAGYMTATILTAGVLCMRAKPLDGDTGQKCTRFWHLSVISSAVITALVLIHVVRPILPIPLKIDRTVHEISGWDQLGMKAFEAKSRMPRQDKVFVFGLRYQVASELAFYMPGQPRTVSVNRWDRPNVYDYWWKDSDLVGFDAVGVMHDRNARSRLLTLFDRVDPPVRIPIYRNTTASVERDASAVIKIYYIYKCYGFNGGLRWVSPQKNDVRNSG